MSASVWMTLAYITLFGLVAAQTSQKGSTEIPSARKCKIYEFSCSNGRCIPQTRYCNNKNECGDGSDEPRYCTRCNRTYYGVIGKTYDLELHRPKEDKIPFICFLTFTANGGDYGDLIQLTFDSFTLGRFVSFTTDGCPDGALQISESNRPQVGGSWCGTSWGPVIYYSETKSVTVSVNLYRLSKVENGYNFDYRMEFKFLKRMAAIVRYGGRQPPSMFNLTEPSTAADPEPEYYLGDLIAGTYCSRIFSDCDRKYCRLQSPNFPGIYPRNLTCYYAVRQHEIPPGKHALITVRQPKGQLVSIRSQSALFGTATPSEIKVWDACDDVQDYVTIYDGYTTRDPVILKFCGGGEEVPPAVSSGHELLVEFSSSPYGTFLHPTPIQALHGFQLEVEVTFVDVQSPSFNKQKRNCEFWIRGTNRGVLESPLHSIPANTTCLYHLQGLDATISPSPSPSHRSRYPDWRHVGMILPPPRYRVWLSVLKFHVASTWDPKKADQICRSYLNVWDGQLWTPSNCEGLYCSSMKEKSKSRQNPTAQSSSNTNKKNVTMLARYCREHVPRSCDHSLLGNVTRFPRPCTLAESFLSSGDSLTLELKVADSTALKPVTFKVLYEFVDLHMDGEPYGEGPCSRRFGDATTRFGASGTSSGGLGNEQQMFKSPRDIFLYGRGGSKDISCVYRFEVKKDERIKITITDMTVKNRRCETVISKDTNRLECSGNTSATLRFYEVPWNDVPGVPKDCLCTVDKNRLLPFTYFSTSNVVELRFTVVGMNASDDFDTLFFEGHWKYIKTPGCKKNLRYRGASGVIAFTNPTSYDEINCETNPRVIIPGLNKYLYVKISGFIMRHSSTKKGNSTIETITTGQRCHHTNRIVVHTAVYSALICPSASSYRQNLVEVFSEGWNLNKEQENVDGMALDKIEIDHLGTELSKTVVVEFYGKEEAEYYVNWLELSRRRDAPPNGLGLFMMRPDECQYRCPELDACINSSVWCDGIENCPSGIDEAITHCSILLQLPPIYLFFGALGLILSSFLTGVVLWKTCRRRPRSILQTRLKSLSSDTAIIDDRDIIC